MKKDKPRAALGLVFGIVFLDIVGFSILFPLCPSLLEFYLGREGDGSFIGGIVEWLSGLAGGSDGNWAVVTLFGGLLGTLYSLLQFLFAPIWGALSDRIGRRPTLLITLVGTAAGYLLWMFSGSFVWLLVSRIVGGIMAGNISTATAVAADTTSSEKRASAMGIVGMAIGLGFVLGPALGGIAAPDETALARTYATGLAWNPFSMAATLAFGLSLFNLLFVALRLKETLPPERRGKGSRTALWNPLGTLARLGLVGVSRTTAVYFLYLTAFSAMEFTLTFLARERLNFGPRDNMWMFVFVGFVIAFVQGAIVRRSAPKLGEKKLAIFGLIVLLPGFFAIAVTHSVGLLYTGLFAMAVGSGLAMPCLSSLVSRYSPAENQGLVLGSFRSAGALARAIGPILGGLLYWQMGSAAPYWVGGLFLLLPLGLSLKLPRPPLQEPEGIAAPASPAAPGDGR
jgi:MFS family permease